MAPRRGGGGGGGSIKVKACSEDAFDPYYDSLYGSTLAYFIGYCIFFLVALVTLICFFQIRKRHPHSKKILGVVFGLSVFFDLIYFTLRIISTTLRECDSISGLAYYDFILALFLFAYIARYLLLILIFWTVPNQLRLLAGKVPSYQKILSIVVLGIMGALTATYIGISSYNTYGGVRKSFYGSDSLYDEQEKLSMGYWVLYLITVIGGGALSFMAIAALRAKATPTGNLRTWCIALTFVSFIWVLFYIIEVGSSLANKWLGANRYQAFSYIEMFFQSLSWIVILFLAKSRHIRDIPLMVNQTRDLPDYNNGMSYGGSGGVPELAAPPQQQYAYNQGPHPYQYQQMPVQGQTNAPTYMVQPKA